MLDFLTVKNRLATIFKIGCGLSDNLADLDISTRGFKQSFQALIVAILPLFIDIIYSIKFTALPNSFSEIILNTVIISIILWFLPLGVIVLALHLMQLKNKAIAFTIPYNWFQAFFNLVYLPFTLIIILFPNTDEGFAVLTLILLIPLFYMMYKVFAAVFQEAFIFNFGISFLNIIVQIFVISISIIFFRLKRFFEKCEAAFG